MSAKLEEFQLDGNRSVCGPRVPPLPACGESIRGLRPPFLVPRTPMRSIGYGAKRAGEGGCPRTRPLRNAPHPDPLSRSRYIRLRPLNSDRTRVNPSSVASGERECTEIQARSARARRKRSSYLMVLIWLKIASAPISLAYAAITGSANFFITAGYVDA